MGTKLFVATSGSPYDGYLTHWEAENEDMDLSIRLEVENLSRYCDDLGLPPGDVWPTEPGYYVWEGSIRWRQIGEDEVNPEGKGTWTKIAT